MYDRMMVGSAAETLDRVRSILVSTLGIQDRRDAIDASTPLFGSLPELDSMSVVELVVAIEDAFDITIDDDELTGETFDTLGSLTDLVETKVSAGGV